MMLGYELSSVVLNVGDRYVIQGLIGSTQLGVYSAAYNLCVYVQLVCINSVTQALMPIYMRLWSESGAAETRRFLEQSLRHYVVLALPVAAGLTAVGSEFLPAVASEKYLAGAVVIPFVMGGLIVDGAGTILGAGLFIQKQTKVIGALVVASAVGNIALNLVLVPRQGIVGAAIATFASYVVLTGGMAVVARRRLPVTMPWGALLKAALASAVMYAAVRPLHVEGRLLSSVLKAAAGVAVYAVAIAALDRDSRVAIVSAYRRLRGRA
jgi:O-antigen/teichoic acid export membrane protein